MSESADSQECGLVMPFVVCDDDGPYEAESFVAGWECGSIEAALTLLAPLGGVIQRWVKPALIPQLDLIAMKHEQALHRGDLSDDLQWQHVRIGHPLLVEEEDK